MEGPLWHWRGGGGGGGEQAGWVKLFVECCDGALLSFECEDGQASIPTELDGVQGNELPLGTGADAVLEQHDGAPTNFGLAVRLKDREPLKFCADSKKLLVKWRKAIKAASAEASAADGEQLPAPAQGPDAEAPDAEASDAAPVVAAPAPPARPTPPEAQPEEDVRGENEDPASESDASAVALGDVVRARVARGEIMSVLVNFEDLELELAFSSQEELDRVTVLELKRSVCLKVNKEEGRNLTPNTLDLLLGDVVLREYWCGEEVCLRPGNVLDAVVREDGEAGAAGATQQEKANRADGTGEGARRGKLLLSVNMVIGSAKAQVSVMDTDQPEAVAARTIERLGLPASHALPVQSELYRLLWEKSRDENKSLKNRVLELKHQLSTSRAAQPVDAKTREAYDVLLERASGRVAALEKEKQRLSDELFELRLINAERLSSSQQ